MSDGGARGYVDVPVATVWTDPGKPRPVDGPALTDPVGLEEWLSATTTAEKRWLSDENATQTQALYGTPVEILGSRSGWYEVAVADQPTPKHPLGYPGWIPAAQVSIDPRFGSWQEGRPFALVDRSATAPLYRDGGLSHRGLELSYDTRLPVREQTDSAIEVALPGGGSAWLAARDASVYAAASEIPAPTGAELVRAARLFLGRPYVWGGASGWACDCSGLTHVLYHAHGIVIGRDAGAQASAGTPGSRVERADLQSGDLIFYGSDPADPSTISHVAMCAGDGTMIEAHGAGAAVRITPVRAGAGYWGAKRLL